MLYCVMFLAALLSMAGCQVEGTWLQKYSETVMTPGMRIEATNANGTVVITAGKGTRRTYEGDGWSRSAQLIARTQRWNGSLGLYHGGIGGHGQVVQAEEGRIHVRSVDEATVALPGERHHEAGLHEQRTGLPIRRRRAI